MDNLCAFRRLASGHEPDCYHCMLVSIPLTYILIHEDKVRWYKLYQLAYIKQWTVTTACYLYFH